MSHLINAKPNMLWFSARTEFCVGFVFPLQRLISCWIWHSGRGALSRSQQGIRYAANALSPTVDSLVFLFEAGVSIAIPRHCRLSNCRLLVIGAAFARSGLMPRGSTDLNKGVARVRSHEPGCIGQSARCRDKTRHSIAIGELLVSSRPFVIPKSWIRERMSACIEPQG